MKVERARTMAIIQAIAVLGFPVPLAAVAPTSGGGTEVIRPDGDPVPDIDVALVKEADRRVLHHVRTDSGGRFAFKNVPEGRYRLMLEVGVPAADTAPALELPRHAGKPKPAPDNVRAPQRYQPAGPGGGQGDGAAGAAPRGIRVRVSGTMAGVLVRTFGAAAQTREIEVDVAARGTVSGTVTRERDGTR